MRFVVGDTLVLSVEATSAPASPVTARVQPPGGADVAAVALAPTEADPLVLEGEFVPDVTGWHEWTVETGAPPAVANGERFLVEAQAVPAV